MRNLAALNLDISLLIGILQMNTFAHWVQPDKLENIENFEYTPLEAGGLRDMGAALTELNQKLSRKAFFVSATEIYNPIIIYVLYGLITDNWFDPLQSLKKNKWYQKSVKIAFAMDEESEIISLLNIIGKMGIVVKTDDSESFFESFKDIVISCIKNSWIFYISDFIEETKSCRDILQSVLTETNLEHHDKATVLLGIDADELDTSIEYDETNRDSTVFMNRRKNMKKVITHAEEIEVTDKPISILRCEVEACSPDKSHEQCFLLKPRRVTEDDGSVSITDTLDVENITYGNISVVYQINYCRSFDIPSQKQMEICGCLELSYNENKVFVKPINESKLTLIYTIGEHFGLEPGDEITNGSMTLLRYYSESEEWSEWGEEWN